jgi:hypothetical protein
VDRIARGPKVAMVTMHQLGESRLGDFRMGESEWENLEVFKNLRHRWLYRIFCKRSATAAND